MHASRDCHKDGEQGVWNQCKRTSFICKRLIPLGIKGWSDLVMLYKSPNTLLDALHSPKAILPSNWLARLLVNGAVFDFDVNNIMLVPQLADFESLARPSLRNSVTCDMLKSLSLAHAKRQQWSIEFGLPFINYNFHKVNLPPCLALLLYNLLMILQHMLTVIDNGLLVIEILFLTSWNTRREQMYLMSFPFKEIYMGWTFDAQQWNSEDINIM